MRLLFYKYQGTGNDFIMIDNRDQQFPAGDTRLVKHLCDRKFGIGADGLILLEPDEACDFKMVYHNADGQLSSMCGNGGRCIVHFARGLGIISSEASFVAVDGVHQALIQDDVVNLQMNDVKDIKLGSGYCYMNTGSPHYLVWRTDIEHMNFIEEAHKIRFSPPYKTEGTNVNFLNYTKGQLHMRTYERGVEEETLSCGTGMVAAALYASLSDKLEEREACRIYSRGGCTEIKFRRAGKASFDHIRLIGNATPVYQGTIDVGV